jgi:transmembrane 9 superfamily protein 2/4
MPGVTRLALCVLALVLMPAVLSMVPLPGLEARVYRKGTPIPLLVNKLTSPRTQLPYSYYSLPFCKPATIDDARENLGEMLIGDRLETSAYNVCL